MGRVDQDHACNFAAVKAGVDANVKSTHGVADENVRCGDSGSVEESVQLLGEISAGTGVAAVVAEAEAGAVVGTGAGEMRDRRLHFFPGNVRVSEPGGEEYCG